VPAAAKLQRRGPQARSNKLFADRTAGTGHRRYRRSTRACSAAARKGVEAQYLERVNRASRARLRVPARGLRRSPSRCGQDRRTAVRKKTFARDPGSPHRPSPTRRLVAKPNSLSADVLTQIHRGSQGRRRVASARIVTKKPARLLAYFARAAASAKMVEGAGGVHRAANGWQAVRVEQQDAIGGVGRDFSNA